MLELQTAKHSLWTCVSAQPSALPPLLLVSHASWATLTVRELAAAGLHVRDADAVGVLVGVGEIQPEGPSNSWQWVFLTDASCWDASSPIPRLLAVRRGGSTLGTDWFDPGVRPGACCVRFRGLAPEGADERGDCVVARLRRAGTGELLDVGDPRGRELEAWAKRHPACLEQCADTVRRLLGE
ncbi:hypothetical protein H632_c95p5 [Helicosporidium sp. ATCC 50920]|nr:hypothetical protein H632_c95p5 [Helicosporidium sp. ATCC 50920]|eukprot:KDD76822.1 hypothetical protein H632_c95p5 [Helicosporidium sp. ATCC 50920]